MTMSIYLQIERRRYKTRFFMKKKNGFFFRAESDRIISRSMIKNGLALQR